MHVCLKIRCFLLALVMPTASGLFASESGTSEQSKQAIPKQLELNQLELNQLELNQLELNQLELNQLELNQLELNQLELNQSTETPRISAVHNTPAGSFLSYGDKTLLLPGCQLPDSVISILLTATADTVYSRVMTYLLNYALMAWTPHLPIALYVPIISATQLITRAPALYHLFSRVLSITYGSAERAQSASGLLRRGRMPVYTGEELESAAFIDALIHTQEAGSGHSYEFEIAPLSPVATKGLPSPWHRTMGQLINTAIDLDVDLLRLYIHDKELLMDAHTSSGWQTTPLLRVGNSKALLPLLLPKLELSYRRPIAVSSYKLIGNNTGIATALEESLLSCATAHLQGDTTPCKPLTGLTPSPVNPQALLEFPSGETQLHILDSDWINTGYPGSLVITSPQQQPEELQAESRQYRLSRTSALIAETLLYELSHYLLQETLGRGLDYAYKQYHGLNQFADIQKIPNDRSQSVYRVKGQDGRTWIKKTGKNTFMSQTLLSNEAIALKKLNGNGAPELVHSWIEGGGTKSERRITLMEDGGHNFAQVKAKNKTGLRQTMKNSLIALHHLHSRAIGHFDIEPDNIVIDGKGVVRLVDLETSTPLNAAGETVLLVTGDQNWLAPEYKPGSFIGWESDIWQLGNTLLSLFNNSPLEEIPIYHDINNYDSLKTHQNSRLQFMPDFQNLIWQMKKKEPHTRPSAVHLLKHPFITGRNP